MVCLSLFGVGTLLLGQGRGWLKAFSPGCISERGGDVPDWVCDVQSGAAEP